MICPSLQHFSFENAGTDAVLQAAAAALESREADDDVDDYDLDPGLLNDDLDYAPLDDGGFADGGDDGAMNDFVGQGGSHLLIGAHVEDEEGEVEWTDAALVAPLFDAKMLRNWAGPEHWRLRPLKGLCPRLGDYFILRTDAVDIRHSSNEER